MHEETVMTMNRTACTRSRTLLLALAVVCLLPWTAMADNDKPDKEPEKLHLRAGSFDPKKETGPASLPAAAQYLPPQAKAVGIRGRYNLVQFDAPIRPEWQEAIRGTGAKIVQYVPDYAFVVQMTPAQETDVRNVPHVTFVGNYKPSWKVDPDLLMTLSGPGAIPPEWSVVVQPGESIAPILAAMKRIYPGMQLVKGGDDGARRVVIRVAPATAITLLQYILDNDAIAWVEPYYERKLLNDESVWVIQSGVRVAGDVGGLEYANSAPIWTHGIRGTGQIVAVADSGLTDNDCFFRPAPAHQSVAAPGAITVDATKRKVLAYNVLPGAQDGDHLGTGTNPCDYHGSHVNGSIGGDSDTNLSSAGSAGHNTADGMAPQSKLVFQDIGALDANSDCSLAGIPNDLHDLFDQAYNAGARIHSDSWGGGDNGVYDTESQQVDDYMFTNEYMLTLFAAGNAGPTATTVGSPGTSKNTLTIAAGTRGSNTAGMRMAYYSGRGPTVDGRTKPDILAPGDSIVSHNGDATACNTQTMSGTSMATPTTAGAAILARQYFADGWYPSGAAVPGNSMTPTSAALKAVLTAGARAMTDRDCQTALCPAGNGIVAASPNPAEGWGRVTLADSLYFSTASVPASTIKLKLWDVPNNAGVTTGVNAEYILPSVAAGTRLHIMLAWNDVPGALGAAKDLVDDLNLEVIAPNGTTIYHGNQWAATATGLPKASSVGPAAYDTLNNLEGVQIAAPAAGDYRIRVRGFNVPGYPNLYDSRQGYAIAATGSFSNTCALAAPAGLGATTPSANQVNLSWSAVPGATGYAIYRSLAGQASCATGMAQIGNTNGTTFNDTTVQGGFQYSYYVKTLSPCDGPASNCVTVTTTGNCTLKPVFAGLTSATNAGTASCAVNLSWSAATSSCPLGNTVKYNIYRSTTPGFTPAAGNRIQSCVSGTTFNDTGMTSGQSYFYVVRAEDSTTANGGPCNGGNEDTNAVTQSATPLGNTTTVGTWTDSDTNTRNQLILAGSWAIVSTADNAGYPQTGTYAYKTSAGTTNYPDSTCASARTPVISLAGNTTVSFWERHSAEFQFDGIVVEYSTNGGSSWTKLNGNAMYGGATFTNAGNACGYATTDSAFQSTANPPQAFTAYASRSFNVTASAGTNFVVRWTLSSDGGVNDLGFLLDNISITNANVPQACVICTTPGVPTGLAATTPSNNTVHLAWSAGSPAGATYNVYRSNGACPGGVFSQIASGIAALTYDDSGLTGGSAYSYKVAAVDITAGCVSAFSSCAGATATGGPGLSSRGRTTSARPEDTSSASSATRWIYNSGATTLVPPGIGSVYAVSNDRVLHGLVGGAAGGGLWGASFTPWLTNAPVQSRPPVPSIPIGASTKEVFLGAQDGNVYCVDANNGTQIWRTAAPLGDMIQASVGGIFSIYGGGLNLLAAGTRNSSTPNAMYGLNPNTGATAWMFNNGGGASGIGIIAGDPFFDYGSVNPAKNKVYFTSRSLTGGSTGTVWCLDITGASATLCSEPGSSWPVSIGDADSAPTLFNNRLYIGTNSGAVYCLNPLTGATIWTINVGDGPIKGFVDPDWMASNIPYRLYIATSTKVTALVDNGASASTFWSQSIASPSIPLYTGTELYVGSSDGRLYEMTNLAAGAPTVKSVQLGTGAYSVGSPSYDFSNGLAYVGTDSGKLYAVTVPLP
jgi:outer membrane protein assembly factor BamB